MTLPNWVDHEDWLRIVPSVHGRVPFACAVRAAFEDWRPERVAVELPPGLAPYVQAGVERLPRLSVVSVPGAWGDGEEDVRSLVPIDPGDSLIEALRLARELELPVEFVDAFDATYEPPFFPLPDPALAAHVGVRSYVDKIAGIPPRYRDARSHDIDRARELHIAWQVGALRDFGRILLVCGCAHLRGILQALEQPSAPPLFEDEPRGMSLLHVHPESVQFLVGELPFATRHYLRRRARHAGGHGLISWQPERVIELLLEQSERNYEHHWGHEVTRPERRALRRFAGKLAATSGRLVPSLYDLVVAAKGCRDDDLAAEVHELATAWPEQEDNEDDLEVLHLDEQQLQSRSIRLLRRDPLAFGKGRDPTEVFRRRLRPEGGEDWHWSGGGGCSYVPEDLRQLQWIGHVRHEAPDYLEEQRTILREWSGSLLDGIDLRETLRNWWQKKIIVREEARLRGAVGPVVVIYDDEPLDEPGRYPNCMTWPGEGHDEGDLVLFSTEPGEQLVGPGISRCEYGGFLSLPGVHLGFWQNPWEILPHSGWVETKGEVLLVTAALCANATFIACISDHPPRRSIVQRCEKLGHPLIHIPAAGFTPATLAKLRVFHVLESLDVRANARDYIEPRPRGFRA